MRETRRKMRAGIPLSACKACYQNEQNGAWSYRAWANDYWLRENPAAERHRTTIVSCTENEIAPRPISGDLRIGNLCNLKCKVCNGEYSSQIARDPTHAAWNPTAPLDTESRFDAAGDWSEAPALLEEIVVFFDNVEYIQLAGGEPTINRTQIGWLEHLRDTGRSGNITLKVSTNFTTANSAVFDLFAAFKEVRLHLSIDGYGKLNEYLRYPSRWSAIERNAAYIRKYRDRFVVTVTPVVNAYNALTLPELFQWVEEQGYLPFISYGRGIEQMDLRRLPPPALAEVERRWREYGTGVLARSHNQEAARRVQAQNLIDQMDSIFGELQQAEPTHKKRNTIADFMKFTNDLDRSRKQSFKEAAPEAYQYVVDYHGSWDNSGQFYSAGESGPQAMSRSSSVGPTLTNGLEQHRAGNLAVAETIYRDVLAAAPADFRARYMLGMLLLQRGGAGELRNEAISLLRSIIAEGVDDFTMRDNIVAVFTTLGVAA